MLPLSNKTCTKFSMFFLVCCIPAITLLIVPFFMGDTFQSLIKLQVISAPFVYYSWYLFSGISLLFSMGMRSKYLKWLAVFAHFSCVYGVVLPVIPLFGGMSLLIGVLTYLLLPLLSQRKKTKKWVHVLLLGIPMLFSISCFVKVNDHPMSSLFSWEILGYMILLSFSGLVGLILSTTLNNGKIKWLLLGLNYLFITYFHVISLFVPMILL